MALATCLNTRFASVHLPSVVLSAHAEDSRATNLQFSRAVVFLVGCRRRRLARPRAFASCRLPCAGPADPLTSSAAHPERRLESSARLSTALGLHRLALPRRCCLPYRPGVSRPPAVLLSPLPLRLLSVSVTTSSLPTSSGQSLIQSQKDAAISLTATARRYLHASPFPYPTSLARNMSRSGSMHCAPRHASHSLHIQERLFELCLLATKRSTTMGPIVQVQTDRPLRQ